MTGSVSSLALGIVLLSGATAYAEEPAAAERVSSEKERKLDNIVVTAAGYQQNIVDAPASITLLPAEELEQQRVNSLAEALRNVPGVDVGNGVGKTGGQSIAIRGMPSDYTLVLVDGRRQNAAGNVTPNGFGDTSSNFIPPVSATERIEVVRGPMSTLYGSDAMGGVINIITRTPDEDFGIDLGFDTTLQGDDAFGNSYNTTLYADGPIVSEQLSFAVRGRYYEREASDLIFTDANGDPIEVSKRGPSPVEGTIWSAGGRLTYTPNDDHRIWFDVDVNKQAFDNSKVNSVHSERAAMRMSSSLTASNSCWPIPAMCWAASWTPTLRATRRRPLAVSCHLMSKARIVSQVIRDLEATNTIYNARFYRTIGAHTFTLGGQFWDAEMTDGVAVDEFTHEQWALFAENQWQIIDDLALTLGVRYDNHSTFGEQLSPRAYLVWTANEYLTLKGGVSRGFKTPRLEQIASGIIGFRGQGTIPVLGTPTLQPETSTTYEAGAYFDVGNGLTGNITVFQNVFEDKIANGPELINCSYGLTEEEYAALEPSDSCVDYGYWPRPATYSQSINVDEAETRGIEASLRKAFDKVTVSVNYTYQDSGRTSGPSEGEPLVNVPEHQLNSRVNWDVTSDINLWIRGEYASERYRGAGEAQEQLGDYSSYVLFNLGGGWKLNDNVTFNATIDNLFDEDFIQYMPYESRGSLAYSNEYAINQEPRRLWLSVNLNY